MNTSALRNGDIIADHRGAEWQVRWVPMKWGEHYIYAAPVYHGEGLLDGRVALCRPADHDSWLGYALFARTSVAI